MTMIMDRTRAFRGHLSDAEVIVTKRYRAADGTQPVWTEIKQQLSIARNGMTNYAVSEKREDQLKHAIIVRDALKEAMGWLLVFKTQFGDPVEVQDCYFAIVHAKGHVNHFIEVLKTQ